MVENIDVAEHEAINSVSQASARTGSGLQKAVVVHAGARDAYQLALALTEANLLDALVTDLFWPADIPWLNRSLHRLAPRLHHALMRRTEPGLPSRYVQPAWLHGIRTFVLDKLPRIPFSWRRNATRSADKALGRKAGRRARRSGAGLVTYSYTGFDAIRAYGRPSMLFQVHPHPKTVRRLLQQELDAHPDCAQSLLQEWELALPEEDFQFLVQEAAMAQRYLVASSFSRLSLTENGVPHEAISVVPYGVDLERFKPAPAMRSSGGPLRLLFVGRINQRKGIKYLLQALQMLNTDSIHLTICGRVVDDLALFAPLGSRVHIRPSVSAQELVHAYQSADLFVFPSVAEGFGQVLLESLASGLPILSTTHTAAPDLIEDGAQGFILEPRNPAALAERLDWAATHRTQLSDMGESARRRAEQFTWKRFRNGAICAVENYLASCNKA